MKLQPSPFEMIKEGKKTIESRLLDEKRQLVNVGDTITFVNRDTQEEIKTKVIELLKYATFDELFSAYPSSDFRGTDKEDLMGIYKYYTKEEEKFGVVGIKIEI